jgi:hypothetical protein
VKALEPIWNCGSGGGSKCFSLKNASKLFFYFLKIIFYINVSKRSKNTKKILILNKNKFQFFRNTGLTMFPNEPLYFNYPTPLTKS